MILTFCGYFCSLGVCHFQQYNDPHWKAPTFVHIMKRFKPMSYVIFFFSFLLKGK